MQDPEVEEQIKVTYLVRLAVLLGDNITTAVRDHHYLNSDHRIHHNDEHLHLVLHHNGDGSLTAKVISSEFSRGHHVVGHHHLPGLQWEVNSSGTRTGHPDVEHPLYDLHQPLILGSPTNSQHTPSIQTSHLVTLDGKLSLWMNHNMIR